MSASLFGPHPGLLGQQYPHGAVANLPGRDKVSTSKQVMLEVMVLAEAYVRSQTKVIYLNNNTIFAGITEPI